jgi:hypothetical protein
MRRGVRGVLTGAKEESGTLKFLSAATPTKRGIDPGIVSKNRA